MYIFNETINVDESIHEKWLHWMKEVRIPEMLSTGKFSKAKMCKVMIHEEMGGITYSIQYSIENLDILQQYYTNYSQKFHAEALQLFKDKFVVFRTELEVISEQYSLVSKN